MVSSASMHNKSCALLHFFSPSENSLTYVYAHKCTHTLSCSQGVDQIALLPTIYGWSHFLL